MIITRSPLRITLGGGGTDLPSYYRRRGGFLIAGAIDKYVYVTVMRPFVEGIFLKYSRLEHVATVAEVQHPILREAIRLLDFRTPQIEITTLADIPAGTGLGSSGSFTTALLKALHAHRRRPLLADALAAMACDLEMNTLGEPIGKQDQYAAAYGGVTCFTFNPDDSVCATPLKANREALSNLEENLLLFFTRFSRTAGSILQDQKDRADKAEPAMLQNLDYVKDLGYRCQEALEGGRTAAFGELMHEHWEHKKKRSGAMSNPQIDAWYKLARENGAMGGKLVGAGGGGFLLFYSEEHRRLRSAMAQAGLEELRFSFDYEGTKALLG
jgi:D-glycero-alpha-D-manno-heptose-7-phosphate kinase